MTEDRPANRTGDAPSGASILGAAARWLARLAEAAAAQAAASGARRSRAEFAAAPPGDPATRGPARRVGIVFVHGIGVQKPDETLLDWGGALLEALAAWRMRLAADGTTLAWDEAGPWPPDGVVAASLHVDGSAPSLIEVVVPGIAGRDDPAGRPQRWLITETWWAANVEPPSLSQVADWTGRDGVLGRVVFGILGRRVRVLRRLLAPGLGLFISSTAFLALLGFQVARAIAGLIPIAGVRKALTAQSVGAFLVDWWGDVYVLLRDPAQAANVRGTLAESIRMLRAEGVDAVAVIAHSGGTLVTFTTLSDPALADVAADTFITHGQAIELARTIVATAPVPKGMTSERTPLGNLQTEPLGPRVRAAVAEQAGAPRDVKVGRWHDFYGSQDPAPFGQPLPDCVDHGPARQTTAVVNRLSLREDHGSYWTNDEEFVLPVLRELDVTGLPGEASRFPAVAPATVTRRHQRVAIRSAWGRASTVVPATALLASMAYASPGLHLAVVDPAAAAPGLIGSMGKAVAAGISAIPGADLVGGILGALKSAVTDIAPAASTTMSAVAAFALGALLTALVVYAVVPVRAWRHFRSRRGWLSAALLDFGLSGLLVGAGLAVVGGWGTGLLDVPGFGAAPVAGVIAGPLAIAFYAVAVRGWDRLVPRFPALDDIATGAAVLALAAIVLCLAWGIAFDVAIQTWLFGLAATAVIAAIAVRIGLARWSVWDARERSAARLRPEGVHSLGRVRVAVAGFFGLGILVAMVHAVAIGDGRLLVAAVAAAVLVGTGLAITDVERGREGS